MPSIRSKMGRPATPSERRYGSRSRRRVPRPPRKVVLALVLAVAGVAAVVTVATREDVRAGSIELPPQPRPLDITRTLSSYQIDYRIEDRAQETVVSTDRLWVRRPFEGRVESWTGPPPGDSLLAVRVSRFGEFGNKTTGSEGTIVQTSPSLAASDLRLDVAVPEARGAGRIQVRERRLIAGRACQVYRTGGPVNAGDLKTYTADGEEHADVCVDEAGLVLEEVWVSRGDVLRRRLATTVTENPEFSDDVFEMPEGRPLEPKDGGGSIRQLVPDSKPPGESFFEVSGPPGGYTFSGRHAVVPAAPRSDDPQARGRMMASVVDVWVSGPDVVLVEVGGTLGLVDVLTPDSSGTPVEAGEAGSGQLIAGLRMYEVRVLQGRGKFVRVLGTADPDVLVRLAQGIRKVPPGEALTCLSSAGQPEPCVSPRPSPSPGLDPDHDHEHEDAPPG